jgi:hypothetical protein
VSQPAFPELMCSACLYVRPRPGLDDDDLAELTVFTVIDGQMLCLRHAGCASSSHHNVIMDAVQMEGQGRFDSLSAYQDWRHKQDREAEA